LDIKADEEPQDAWLNYRKEIENFTTLNIPFKLNYSIDLASPDNFSKALLSGPLVLNLICHGETNCLIFEN